MPSDANLVRMYEHQIDNLLADVERLHAENASLVADYERRLQDVRQREQALLYACKLALRSTASAVETIDDDAPGPGLTIHILIRYLREAIANSEPAHSPGASPEVNP